MSKFFSIWFKSLALSTSTFLTFSPASRNAHLLLMSQVLVSECHLWGSINGVWLKWLTTDSWIWFDQWTIVVSLGLRLLALTETSRQLLRSAMVPHWGSRTNFDWFIVSEARLLIDHRAGEEGRISVHRIQEVSQFSITPTHLKLLAICCFNDYGDWLTYSKVSETASIISCWIL